MPDRIYSIVSVGPRKILAAPTGVLGIILDQSDDGPQINQVISGSGAAKAGLQAGDIVFSVDGKKTKTREDVIALIRTRKPGDSFSLVVKRGEGTFVAANPPRMGAEERDRKLGEAAGRYSTFALNLGASAQEAVVAVERSWNELTGGKAKEATDV